MTSKKSPAADAASTSPSGQSMADLDAMLAAAKPLAIGLIILASGLAIAGYFATKAAWRIYLVRAWHRRRQARLGFDGDTLHRDAP